MVIPDCRFVNEFEAIKAAGGKLVRIKRTLAGLAGAAGKHVSETEQDSVPDSMFDVVICNSGTLEDLALMTDAMLHQFEGHEVLSDYPTAP